MRLALVLITLAALLLSTAAFADQVDVVLYPGLNMIAPPLVPFDPAPESVFVDSTSAPINVDQALFRFDPITKGYVLYDMFDPGVYGGVLLGDGCWLSLPGSSVTWRYDGVPDGVPDGSGVQTDMWISLPATGQSLIGMPFNHTVPAANCLMTDGTKTVSLTDARDVEGWTDATLWVFNPLTQGYEDVGVDPWSTHTDLEAGHAYWISTTKDNLALIIPAS